LLALRYIIVLPQFLAKLFGNVWEEKRTILTIFFSEILAGKRISPNFPNRSPDLIYAIKCLHIEPEISYVKNAYHRS
jgi:hypothetical protein